MLLKFIITAIFYFIKLEAFRTLGMKGKFLYFALGENYHEKITSQQMKNFHEGNEKISSKYMKNFHIKDQLYNINNTNIKKKYIKPDKSAFVNYNQDLEIMSKVSRSKEAIEIEQKKIRHRKIYGFFI